MPSSPTEYLRSSHVRSLAEACCCAPTGTVEYPIRGTGMTGNVVDKLYGRPYEFSMSSIASPRRWPFWACAYTLVVLAVGTNVPSPLYRVYAARFGFTSLTTTLIFATYAAVLIPTMLIAGPLSDAVGRRVVLLPAVGLAVAGAVVFAVATGTWELYLARILQGLSMGAASGGLAAALTELEPNRSATRAALVASVGNAVGLGGGPLLAGVLGEWLPAPRLVPFLAEIGLLGVALVALANLPDDRARLPWRPRRPQLPAEVRPAFAGGGLATFAGFAVVGLFLTLVPSLVTSLTGNRSLFVAGASVSLVLASSACVQLVGYGRPSRNLVLGGLGLLTVGLVLLLVAVGRASLPVLLAASVVGGAGQGLAFLGGLSEVNAAAPAGRRADVLATFYVVAYTGVGFPVVVVGLLAVRIGLPDAVREFAWGGVALLAATLAALLARRARTPAESGARSQAWRRSLKATSASTSPTCPNEP